MLEISLIKFFYGIADAGENVLAFAMDVKYIWNRDKVGCDLGKESFDLWFV